MYRKPKVKSKLFAHALSLAVLCVVLSIEGVAQTSAASEVFKGSAEFRDAVAGTAASVEKYSAQLEKTDRSLTRLSRADGDSGERYESFAKDLRKLEKVQKNAASDIERMRARETGYFTAFDKANMQIADPELRRSLAIRRSHMTAQYQALADDLSAIGRELQPLMSHLRDLNLFLGADQSQANLKGAYAMIGSARHEIRSLKQDIAEVQRRLGVFLNEISSKS